MSWPPRWLSATPARTRGEGVCEFVESFCRVTKDSVGGRAGDLLVLRRFQRELLCALMAEDESGHLKHRQALIGLARKNGKSALGASLALSALVCGPIGAEVYSCAGDRDQARIVFGTAKAMVELDPELSAVCKVYRTRSRSGTRRTSIGSCPPTHHGRKGSARRS